MITRVLIFSDRLSALYPIRTYQEVVSLSAFPVRWQWHSMPTSLMCIFSHFGALFPVMELNLSFLIDKTTLGKLWKLIIQVFLLCLDSKEAHPIMLSLVSINRKCGKYGVAHADFVVLIVHIMIARTVRYLCSPFAELPRSQRATIMKLSERDIKQSQCSMVYTYMELTRLHKFPLGSIAVFWPCGERWPSSRNINWTYYDWQQAWGLALAARGENMSLWCLFVRAAIAAIGSTLIHSAACIWSDICDVDFDRKVG